jgi:predicted RNA polymerase sigma factor
VRDSTCSAAHLGRPASDTTVTSDFTGPRAGLAVLEALDSDDGMGRTHRVEAVRGHLLELAGDTAAARESYGRAAEMTASLPERRYLTQRAARLRG